MRLAALLAALFAAEADRWPLFIPVVFGSGIAGWFMLPAVGERQALVLAGLAVSVAGLLLEGRARRIVLAAGLLLSAGVVAAEVRSLMVAGPRLYHRVAGIPVEAMVERVEIRSGGERARLWLRRPETARDPSSLVTISLRGEVPDFVRPGARVRVMASLGPVPGPVLPGAYDAARRAFFDGVGATGRATGPPRLLAAAEGQRFAELRQRLSRRIQTLVPGEAGAVAVALSVGEQGQVPPRLLEAMRVSGLAHLLTVSGLHIAIVFTGAMLAVRRLLALWPWLVLRMSAMRAGAFAGGVGATAYVLLSGADVPAVRAGVMAWVIVAGMWLGRNPVSLRLLAFAALLILALRPEALVNPSFQLSFAAVGALVLLGESAPGRALFRASPDEAFIHRAGRHLAALLVTGIVAELVLSPVALGHFGRAGFYGVIANIAAIPLTSFVIMPLLGLFLAADMVGAGAAVAPVLGWSIERLDAIAYTVATWPGAAIAVPAVPSAAFGTGMAGAIVCALFRGRLRLAGLPLVVAGLTMAVGAPRPDIFIASDARQVGIVQGGRLYMLRPHRGGFMVGAWGAAAAAPAEGLIADLNTAACAPGVCFVDVGHAGFRLAAGDRVPPQLCAAADLVVAPAGIAGGCTPRWRKLDRAALMREGAVAVVSGRRHLESVGQREGDHPWSPAALPGQQMTLLGRQRWIGVLSE
jgi:competence protein ComEC